MNITSERVSERYEKVKNESTKQLGRIYLAIKYILVFSISIKDSSENDVFFFESLSSSYPPEGNSKLLELLGFEFEDMILL